MRGSCVCSGMAKKPCRAFNVFLNEDHKARLKQLAELDGRSASGLIRRWVDEAHAQITERLSVRAGKRRSKFRPR